MLSDFKTYHKVTEIRKCSIGIKMGQVEESRNNPRYTRSILFLTEVPSQSKEERQVFLTNIAGTSEYPNRKN